MAPQLISCMEIIFKTEQNGGQLLSGRVGLCRAPGAAWHVTVYACLLNKRCWPRWKSAIGHLICYTCVIGLYPNTQYIYYPLACRLSCSRGCKYLHRSTRIKKWTVHSKEQTCCSSSWQFFSLHCHLCGSGPFSTPYILKGTLIKENIISFLAVHITQLTVADWICPTFQPRPCGSKHAMYIFRSVRMNEPGWKGVLYQHCVEAFYIIDMQFDCLPLINN